MAAVKCITVCLVSLCCPRGRHIGVKFVFYALEVILRSGRMMQVKGNLTSPVSLTSCVVIGTSSRSCRGWLKS